MSSSSQYVELDAVAGMTWLGHTFPRRADGFWQATAMCRAVGKPLPGFYELNSTRAVRRLLHASLGVDPVDVRGRNGTWMHPVLTRDLAFWCSSAMGKSFDSHYAKAVVPLPMDEPPGADAGGADHCVGTGQSVADRPAAIAPVRPADMAQAIADAAARGGSPFDSFRRVRVLPDGTEVEHWSARDVQPLLGYSKWQHLQSAAERAKGSCRSHGKCVGDHFTGVRKVIAGGRWGSQAIDDVEMTRYGMYLLAMNGDSLKPAIAAAQAYFALQTHLAERLLPPVARTVAELAGRHPWMDRVEGDMLDHRRLMSRDFTGWWTVASHGFFYVAQMERHLKRHGLLTLTLDLPDGSIGSRWWTRCLGLPKPVERIRGAALRLPERDVEVNPWAYPMSELGTFESWMTEEYVPQHLYDYYAAKLEFRGADGLALASCVEETCLDITGRPAVLPEAVRRQLPANGRIVRRDGTVVAAR